MKERLILLVGAGASVDAGIPSTNSLTNILRSADISIHQSQNVTMSASKGTTQAFVTPMTSNIPVCETVYRGLQSGFAAPNFEHVLAALEELQAISSSLNSVEMLDRYAHVLAPFVRIDSRYGALCFPGALQFARKEVIKLIAETVNKALAKPGVAAPTKDFITKLKKHFKLTVITLNYDDLLDQSNTWYDGFERTLKKNAFAIFNRRRFVDRCKAGNDDLLLHLHGSVRFGYKTAATLGNNMLELVKYDKPAQAFKTLGGNFGDDVDQGTIVSGPPIISGFHKAAKLAHSPAPYGYYYRAAIEALLEVPRLLVVGYGAGDKYLNGWLEESFILHGNKRRVGFISRCAYEDVYIHEHPPRVLMRGMAEDQFFNNDFAYFSKSEPIPTFQKHGYLGLCTAGFPLDKRSTDLDDMLAFLKAKTLTPIRYSIPATTGQTKNKAKAKAKPKLQPKGQGKIKSKGIGKSRAKKAGTTPAKKSTAVSRTKRRPALP